MKEETKEVDWWIRTLQLKSNVMKIYIKGKYGEQGLNSVLAGCAAELRHIQTFFYKERQTKIGKILNKRS